MEQKAIKISKEAYDKLIITKKLAVQQAKKQGDSELWQALVAMGIGAFAGWLIFKGIKELEKS